MFAVKFFTTARNPPTQWVKQVIGAQSCGVLSAGSHCFFFCLFFVCGCVGDVILSCWLVDWCHSVCCTALYWWWWLWKSVCVYMWGCSCVKCVCVCVGIHADVCLRAPRMEFTSDHRSRACDLNKGYFRVFICSVTHLLFTLKMNMRVN